MEAAARGLRKPMKNLARIGAEEMNDVCGSCHRTWAFVAANGPRNMVNVRFQPYRVTKSKCFDAEDSRIRCTACHDPHGSVRHESSAYDNACRACHASDSHAKVGAKTCPVGKADCASCHMPKYTIPQSHFRFTDHFIRVVKSGEPYPN